MAMLGVSFRRLPCLQKKASSEDTSKQEEIRQTHFRAVRRMQEPRRIQACAPEIHMSYTASSMWKCNRTNRKQHLCDELHGLDCVMLSNTCCSQSCSKFLKKTTTASTIRRAMAAARAPTAKVHREHIAAASTKAPAAESKAQTKECGG